MARFAVLFHLYWVLFFFAAALPLTLLIVIDALMGHTVRPLFCALGLALLFAYDYFFQRWWMQNARGRRFLLQQKYAEAADQFRQGLEGRRFGRVDFRKAFLSDGLAQSLRGLGDFLDAEAPARVAFDILAERLGTDHRYTVSLGVNLGLVHLDLARFAEAEQHFRHGLAVCERRPKMRNYEGAICLNNLAVSLTMQRKYAEAEPIYRQALALMEAKYKKNHQLTGLALCNLSMVLGRLEQFDEAQTCAEQALEIFAERLGANDFWQTLPRCNLAYIAWKEDLFEEAETLLRESLEIGQRGLGKEHPFLSKSLYLLGEVLKSQRRYEEAEVYCQRALRLREEYLVPTHPDVTESLASYADLLEKTGRTEQAADMHIQNLNRQTNFRKEVESAIQASSSPNRT